MFQEPRFPRAVGAGEPQAVGRLGTMQRFDLATFIRGVHGNSQISLGEYPREAALLQRVSDTFTDLLAIPELEAHGAMIFVGMAHADYLAAAQLASGGQLPPSYMASRGCLEAAIYGWWVASRPELLKIWSSRHEDDAARNAVKKSFKMVDMREALRTAAPAVENQFGIAYENAIDLGAHPNSLVLWTNLGEAAENDAREFMYVNLETHSLTQALRVAAFSGITGLVVLQWAFRDIYISAGLPQRLVELLREFQDIQPNFEDPPPAEDSD